MCYFDFELFIKEKREEYIKMVKEIFEDMEKKKIYEQGLADAWEAAKKVVLSKKDGGLHTDCLENIFGLRNSYEIFEKCSIDEVISKIKVYEDKQNEIKVGDEVTDNSDAKFVVLSVFKAYDNIFVGGVDATGTTTCSIYCGIKKTGRHFPQIAEVLEKMKENNQSK